MNLHLKIDLARFIRFVHAMNDSLDVSRPGAVQDAALAGSDAYHEAMRQRFAREGDGDWPPLRPRTVKEREETGYGEHPTLVRAGDLRDSLSRDDGNHYLETTPESVREGSSHWLAPIHHHGAGSRNLPARTLYVPPDAETLNAMKQPMVDGLRIAVKQATA